MRVDTFSVLDGAWVGGVCYPDALVVSNNTYHHKRRMMLIPTEKYIVSVVFGTYTYSSNYDPLDLGEFTEVPTLAEIAILDDEEEFVGRQLFGWDDDVLGYQTTNEVNEIIKLLKKM
jgi:hypothetical protein